MKTFKQHSVEGFEGSWKVSTAEFIKVYINSDIKDLKKKLETYKDWQKLNTIARNAKGYIKHDKSVDASIKDFLQTLIDLSIKRAKVLKKESEVTAKNNIKASITPADWKTFEKLLRSHDWTYQYSDDHKKWSKGNDENKRIQELYFKLQLGDSKRATKMYNKYKG